MDPDEFANESMAVAIAAMNDTFAPIEEAAMGYRARLVSKGWTQASAEAMAVEYFRLLIAVFVKGTASS